MADADPSPAAPTLRAALLTLALALGAAFLPHGPPRGPDGFRAWDGLGGHLDPHLPDRGRLLHERIVRTPGGERKVEAHGRLGAEVVGVALYLLALGPALAYLRRSDRRTRLVPDRADLDRLLTTLAWLVPLYTLTLVGAGLWAAGTDGGAPLRAFVYRLGQPALAAPATAVWPVLRFALLAPLVEEIVWRGIVYRGLRTRLAFGPASVLAAFAFGLWHVLTGWDAPLALASQYLFALVACWLVERTGSLGAPILLHAGGNAAALGLYLLAMFRPDGLLGLFGVG